ncbi:hypothetical protein KSP39_PZI001053 [Platanthera zijinensis]|uniref:Uncharacterized protein n=1 Tax=Platanthera zijinensis TaxID=2320716 RepID=A0AAP0C4C8_9ASPA
MAGSPVHVCLPLDHERINSSTTAQIAVLIDHFDGDFKFSLPWEERADSVFKSAKLNAVKAAIVVFLAGSRLDIDHYIPLLPSLDDLARQETVLLVPTNLPQTSRGLTLTQRERRKEITSKRKEEGDPAADYSSSKSLGLRDFGKSQKDLPRNPMMRWYHKSKHFRLSTTFPSWKSFMISLHSHVATSALYEKRNLRNLQGIPPAELPLLAAQAHANSLITSHYMGYRTRDPLRENE